MFKLMMVFLISLFVNTDEIIPREKYRYEPLVFINGTEGLYFDKMFIDKLIILKSVHNKHKEVLIVYNSKKSKKHRTAVTKGVSDVYHILQKMEYDNITVIFNNKLEYEKAYGTIIHVYVPLTDTLYNNQYVPLTKYGQY